MGLLMSPGGGLVQSVFPLLQNAAYGTALSLQAVIKQDIIQQKDPCPLHTDPPLSIPQEMVSNSLFQSSLQNQKEPLNP